MYTISLCSFHFFFPFNKENKSKENEFQPKKQKDWKKASITHTHTHTQSFSVWKKLPPCVRNGGKIGVCFLNGLNSKVTEFYPIRNKAHTVGKSSKWVANWIPFLCFGSYLKVWKGQMKKKKKRAGEREGKKASWRLKKGDWFCLNFQLSMYIHDREIYILPSNGNRFVVVVVGIYKKGQEEKRSATNLKQNMITRKH